MRECVLYMCNEYVSVCVGYCLCVCEWVCVCVLYANCANFIASGPVDQKTSFDCFHLLAWPCNAVISVKPSVLNLLFPTVYLLLSDSFKWAK